MLLASIRVDFTSCPTLFMYKLDVCGTDHHAMEYSQSSLSISRQVMREHHPPSVYLSTEQGSYTWCWLQEVGQVVLDSITLVQI